MMLLVSSFSCHVLVYLGIFSNAPTLLWVLYLFWKPEIFTLLKMLVIYAYQLSDSVSSPRSGVDLLQYSEDSFFVFLQQVLY